jgi:hypothetical protein
MSKSLVRHRCGVLVGAMLLLSGLPHAASAKEPAAAVAQQVQVHPEYYRAGSRRFADLDRLDDWVKSTGTRSLEFHSCMWTATERLAAAIERFQHVYLDVRWIEPGKDGCPAVMPDKAAQPS